MVCYSCAVLSVDGTAFARNRARVKCIHPRRNDFGSIAVIAPVLRQSSEAGVLHPRLPGLADTFTIDSVRASSARQQVEAISTLRLDFAIGSLIRAGDLDYAAGAWMNSQTKAVKLDYRGYKIEAKTEPWRASQFV